jgi:hypothetical protein
MEGMTWEEESALEQVLVVALWEVECCFELLVQSYYLLLLG